MARHAGGPAPRIVDGPRTASIETTAAEGQVVPIAVDGLDLDRLNRLRETRIRVRRGDRAILPEALEQAARLQAMRPFTSKAVDHDTVAGLVRLLIAFYQANGVIDARRALRRAAVDRYMEQHGRPTQRTVRYYLYAIGRLLYPGEYPPAHTGSSPRSPLTAAASDDDIRTLYSLAPTLGDKRSRVLLLMLDVILGSGARVSELKTLRCKDFDDVDVTGEKILVITLGTAKDAPRRVPVLDAARAHRLRGLVATAPHPHIFAAGRTPKVERNAANRINSDLDTRGLTVRVDPNALRHKWMLEQASVLPLADFTAVAGIIDVRGIRELMGPQPSDVARHVLLHQMHALRDHRLES